MKMASAITVFSITTFPIIITRQNQKTPNTLDFKQKQHFQVLITKLKKKCKKLHRKRFGSEQTN